MGYMCHLYYYSCGKGLINVIQVMERMADITHSHQDAR
jgi:hypothetical protein